jgi:polysaccharide pyruvyl transferase WcaK-like protein
MKVYLFNRGVTPNIGDQMINFVISDEIAKLGFAIENNRKFIQNGEFYARVMMHIESFLDDVKQVSACDITIIGGGNLIMDTRNIGIRWAVHHFWLSILNMLMGKSYYYLSVGVNPLRTIIGKFLYKFVLKRATGISARDSFSRAYIANLTGRDDILLVPDPALKISEIYAIDNSQRKNGNVIGICPIQMYPKITKDPILNEKYQSLNEALIKRLLEMGKKVHVFINSPDDDSPIFTLLTQRISNDNLFFTERFDTILNYVEFISKLEFLISARMHAIICATSYKIPSIGFGWQPKMYNFYQDNGLEGYVDILTELNTHGVEDLVSRFAERIQDGSDINLTATQTNFKLFSIIDP